MQLFAASNFPALLADLWRERAGLVFNAFHFTGISLARRQCKSPRRKDTRGFQFKASAEANRQSTIKLEP